MPDGVALLADRAVRLVVAPPLLTADPVRGEVLGRLPGPALALLTLEEVGRVAARLDEVAPELGVPLVAGCTCEPEQRQLDLAVAAEPVPATRTVAERRRQVVAESPRDVEQRLVAHLLVMRHAGLDEVADRVHLVAVAEVLPARLGPRHRDVAVHIAVGLLGACDRANGTIETRGNRAVRIAGDDSARGLDPFRDVRVVRDAVIRVAVS